jgi:4-hydroxy-tetrahydrodipicolinate synthase
MPQTTTRWLSGIWCPLLTPVDDDLKPDPGRFVEHARWVLDQGCHGIAVFGTTGEATSFSVGERLALLDAALAAGLPRERMMVGTGCCALTDSVDLSRHALAQGVAGLLMLPPFYYKGNSDEALFRSFDLIIQRLGTSAFQLYLYHFPTLSGVPITPGLIELLRDAYPDTMAGVKDSSGDWENTRLLLDRFPDLAIFPGTETLLLAGLEHGGAGCITAAANVNGAAVRAVWDAFQAGDGSARDRQTAITTTRGVLQSRPMIPAMKYLLAEARGDQSWRRVRPPMLALPDAEGRALHEELTGHGLRLAA